MKTNIIAIIFLCLGQASMGEDHSPPAFADAVIPLNQVHCRQGFSSTRSPDNRTLSVIRTARTTKDKEFLMVGPSFGVHDRAECVIDVLFQQPLNAPLTLSVDYRGIEDKQPHTRVLLTVSLGRQSHEFSYADGRWLDGAPGADVKRFLLDVPAGAKKVRIKVSGKATSINKRDSALIGFDALDICFVDPSHPEYCGMAGQPNPHTTTK